MANKKRGFQAGNTYGKVFSSKYQPKKNGRKPALYKKILSITDKKVDFELSKEDYCKIILFLMECTLGELRAISSDERTPLVVCNVARALLLDTKRGRMNTISLVFDRLFGKATMINDCGIKSTVINCTQINLSKLTEEEIKDQLSEIELKIKKLDKNGNIE